jgi:hypothetical protein
MSSAPRNHSVAPACRACNQQRRRCVVQAQGLPQSLLDLACLAHRIGFRSTAPGPGRKSRTSEGAGSGNGRADCATCRASAVPRRGMATRTRTTRPMRPDARDGHRGRARALCQSHRGQRQHWAISLFLSESGTRKQIRATNAGPKHPLGCNSGLIQRRDAAGLAIYSGTGFVTTRGPRISRHDEPCDVQQAHNPVPPPC